MGGERIVFSRPAAELSCIVGSLYESLEPPCGVSGGPDDVITLFGQTHTGEHAVLRVLPDRCIYTGPPEALEAVLTGRCPEGWRCEHGG